MSTDKKTPGKTGAGGKSGIGGKTGNGDKPLRFGGRFFDETINDTSDSDSDSDTGGK